MKLYRFHSLEQELPEVFPGGIAGASLKRRVSLRFLLFVLEFSPAESPGPH